jgi:hypothetical protein
MSTFTEVDKTYREAIEAPGRELRAAFNAAIALSELDLDARDITHAIILRLKSFRYSQEQVKQELGKIYAAPMADFFVETVCFYLKVVFSKLDPSLIVASERTIRRERGSIRPDISIWRGNSVVAAVECKTQLGYKRDGWLSDFENREKKLAESFPNAKLFLLVLTGNNWPGFGNDSRVNKQFFVLLKNFQPEEFELILSNAQVDHPIEGLITEALNCARFKSN